MTVLKLIWKYVLAPLVAVLVVLGAFLLVISGMQGIQIGGLLGKLFGKKTPNKAIDVANSVPPDRVQDGKLIPVGEPDEHGITQAAVVPIEPTGMFSDPDTVQFVPPGEEKAVEVQLPTGVKASDVEQVVVVKPDHFVVTVKDSSPVKPQDIDALLKKYGK